MLFPWTQILLSLKRLNITHLFYSYELEIFDSHCRLSPLYSFLGHLGVFLGDIIFVIIHLCICFFKNTFPIPHLPHEYKFHEGKSHICLVKLCISGTQHRVLCIGDFFKRKLIFTNITTIVNFKKSHLPLAHDLLKMLPLCQRRYTDSSKDRIFLSSQNLYVKSQHPSTGIELGARPF